MTTAISADAAKRRLAALRQQEARTLEQLHQLRGAQAVLTQMLEEAEQERERERERKTAGELAEALAAARNGDGHAEHQGASDQP